MPTAHSYALINTPRHESSLMPIRMPILMTIRLDNELIVIYASSITSYNRVSSGRQTLAKGGGGETRQSDRFEAFRSEFAIPAEALNGKPLVDSGISGSKAHHLKKGAALHAYWHAAKAGSLGPSPILVIESITRLGRMPIEKFNLLFFSLIDLGVTLITLSDRRVYSSATVNTNSGQTYQIQSLMQGAAAMSKDLAGYTTSTWRKRRGTPLACPPRWFDKYANGVLVDHFKGRAPGASMLIEANPGKLAIIQRIFTEVLTMGVDRLVRNLNAEGVPTFAGKGSAWNQSYVASLIRSRTVLGEQRVCRQMEKKVDDYIESVRTFTDVVLKDAYPAVVTEDQWKLANAALDSRVRGKGVQNGRNVTKMANLFGDLAVCDVCGGRMKIMQKGRVGQFKYFGCSNARVGKCAVTRYHRLDKVEACLFAYFQEDQVLREWEPTPVEDRVADLKAQLERAQREADKIFRALKNARMEDDESESSRMEIADYKAQHAAKLDTLKLLDRELTAALAAKPASERSSIVRDLAGILSSVQGEELVSVRAKIAAELAGILSEIRFCSDGRVLAGCTLWPERPIGQQIDGLPTSHEVDPSALVA